MQFDGCRYEYSTLSAFLYLCYQFIAYTVSQVCFNAVSWSYHLRTAHLGVSDTRQTDGTIIFFGTLLTLVIVRNHTKTYFCLHKSAYEGRWRGLTKMLLELETFSDQTNFFWESNEVRRFCTCGYAKIFLVEIRIYPIQSPTIVAKLLIILAFLLEHAMFFITV